MLSAVSLDNVEDGETVHQRCLLLNGRCKGASGDDGHVEVVTKDVHRRVTFPEQRWPMCRGLFKALVMLAPGENSIFITSGQDSSCTVEVSTYPVLSTAV